MSIFNRHSASTFSHAANGVHQLLLMTGLVIFASLTYAGPLTVGGLVSQGAQPQSKEALLGWMPGETLYTGNVNFNEEWTNFPNGKVVGQIHDTSENIGYYGMGTWHISGDGKYCVDINWQQYPDTHWCRSVYSTSGRLYIPDQDGSDAHLVGYTTVP